MKEKSSKILTEGLIQSITENSEIYYISLLLLANVKKKGYSNIPELSLILDEDNFLRLLDVYGGQTIKIPTKADVRRYLQTVMVYYYTEMKGYSMKEALKKANASGNHDIYKNINKLKEIDKSYKLPMIDEVIHDDWRFSI